MTGWTSAAADRGESKVSERVHAALRTRILDGTYAEGEALPGERKLSEELGASRHAVREALKRLQQANLIAISQGGATRVKDWRRHGGLELLLAVAADGEAPPELRAARAAMEMRACIGA
ncbi:MAG TPA: winged helix-turn-helix domain-containing protein, partial [Solirubrobacteraceae bacterium]|nr:winged helix-turn-helix domain-containing protein [Solirubrobacteraceae bacterium]